MAAPDPVALQTHEVLKLVCVVLATVGALSFIGIGAVVKETAMDTRDFSCAVFVAVIVMLL